MSFRSFFLLTLVVYALGTSQASTQDATGTGQVILPGAAAAESSVEPESQATADGIVDIGSFPMPTPQTALNWSTTTEPQGHVAVDVETDAADGTQESSIENTVALDDLEADAPTEEKAAEANEDGAIGVDFLWSLDEDDVADALVENVTAEGEARFSGIWPVRSQVGSDGTVLFAGENPKADFILILPKGPTPQNLSIDFQSGAFVLPERSFMSVFVNGTLVDEFPLDQIVDFGTRDIPMSQGLLHAGLNNIRLEAQQVHRTSCGSEAAFDLWSKVNLSKSGVTVTASHVVDAPESFLSDLATMRSASEPLPILRDGDGSAALGHAQMQIANQLGAALGSGLLFDPATELAVADIDGPYIVLKQGTLPDVELTFDPASGHRVLRVTAGANGTVVLGNLFDLSSGKQTAPQLQLDQPNTLASLGMRTWQVNENLWTEHIGFRLPEDWLIKTKLRAEMRLQFAYVPGLPAGSRMDILMNGHPVQIIPLDRRAGYSEEGLRVRFDAMLMQAGHNILTLKAVFPRDTLGAGCRDDLNLRMEVHANSTLYVPSSPRMAWPDLARGMEHVSIVGLRNVRMPDFSNDPDSRVMALAHALPLERGFSEQPARLTVLNLAELEQDHLGRFQMSARHIQASLAAREEAPDAPILEGDGPVTQIGQFRPQPTQVGAVEGLAAQLQVIFGGAIQDVWSMISPDSPKALEQWLAEQTGLAALFTLDPSRPNDLYLVIPETTNTQVVVDAVGRATTLDVPVSGHMALLQSDGTWTIWADTTRLPELKQELSIGAFRQVLGNFTVSRPRLWVGLILLTAFLSALCALSFLALKGRSK